MNNNASPCKPSECPHRPRSSRTLAQSTPGPGRAHWVPGQGSHSPRSFSSNHQSLRLSKHPPAFELILVCGKVLTSSAKILLRGGETQKTGSWWGAESSESWNVSGEWTERTRTGWWRDISIAINLSSYKSVSHLMLSVWPTLLQLSFCFT